MNWTQYNKIYFIGIGGIGISAIAKIMLELKKQVSGSDLESSSITDELQKQGAHIKIGKHQPGNIPKDVDLIIYSNAIATTNEEYKKAKKLKVPLKSYPEILGIMMANYIPIIISGTHGKSTITAMLAKIFIQAGLDPSVVIGTKIKELDGNARLGLGRYFIAEGDEYKEAFQYYNPVALVVNNIEADHLDYFIKIENILKAFEKIISGVPAGGFLIANADDKNISKLLKKAKCKVITYGINNGDYQAFHIIRHGEIIRFAIKGLERFDLILRTPGIHNIYNALAACVLSLAFGIEHATIQKALSDYKGAWRRFEIKGKKGGVTIIDDYAHHPTEIKFTLQAAREYYPNKKIWCVFQPHSRHRTKKLLKHFAQSFTNCDRLILADIFKVAGRDKNERITIDHLLDEIRKTKKDTILLKDNQIVDHIKRYTKSGDVVIIMGAGDITKLADQLLK